MNFLTWIIVGLIAGWLAGQVMNRLTGLGQVLDEVHGFKYFDERDLMGFVDGTENPGGRAATAAALIGDEDSDFAGGSYVIVQKYLHDLTAWNALPVVVQERIIGRTKLDDIELADDVKPSNSHVALNTITDESGEERQIVRDNMPFGRVGTGEFGTYFIGYAATPEVGYTCFGGPGLSTTTLIAAWASSRAVIMTVTRSRSIRSSEAGRISRR